jgi:hypothetical protein
MSISLPEVMDSTHFWRRFGGSGQFSYDSYEDCMLGRMKGQERSMYWVADKTCKKEFGIEVDVYKRDVKWEWSSDDEISIQSKEYEITTGEFSFSPKPCEGLREADFGKPVQLRFFAGKAKLPVLTEVLCGRALSFKGKYK